VEAGLAREVFRQRSLRSLPRSRFVQYKLDGCGCFRPLSLGSRGMRHSREIRDLPDTRAPTLGAFARSATRRTGCAIHLKATSCRIILLTLAGPSAFEALLRLIECDHADHPRADSRQHHEATSQASLHKRRAGGFCGRGVPDGPCGTRANEERLSGVHKAVVAIGSVGLGCTHRRRRRSRSLQWQQGRSSGGKILYHPVIVRPLALTVMSKM
jgi:hypothetical protein